MKQIVEDEHIAKAREMFIDIEHPRIGKMTVNGNPVKLMDMKPRINRPAPVLGQDNHDVFVGKLGYSEEEYERMKEEKVF